MPIPSSRTTTSAASPKRTSTETVTVPGRSRERKAWTTALVTASEIARRRSSRTGSGTRLARANSTADWRTQGISSTSAVMLQDLDATKDCCPARSPLQPRLPYALVGALGSLEMTSTDDRDDYDRQADQRDRAAEGRDKEAAGRDVRAAIRDALAEDGSEMAADARAKAAGDRSDAGENRRHSAADRRSSAGDRERRRDERTAPPA